MAPKRCWPGKSALWRATGGSAADALHLSEELVGRYKNNRRALPASRWLPTRRR